MGGCLRWLSHFTPLLLVAPVVAAAWSSSALLHTRGHAPAGRLATAAAEVAASVEDSFGEPINPPRPLVIFRPPSRHTYGFVDSGCYDLPRIEMRALLAAAAGCEEEDVQFIPAASSLQPSYEDVQRSPARKPRAMSKQQSKKKRASNSAIDVQSLYWIECGDMISSNDVARAAARAILTHATFSIHVAFACSKEDWDAVPSDATFNEPLCNGMLEQMDAIDMSNPNMSSEDRSRLMDRVSWVLQQQRDAQQSLQKLQTNGDDGTTMALLHQEGERVHNLYFGHRTAIGPAGTRGAPSQTLRRTHRGLLMQYALKNRPKENGERSNISTAMEPEIGFLMANLALAGEKGARVLDPCCGSGRLLLYASALGATKLVGVDSDSYVWEGAEDEFRRHRAIDGKSALTTPTFFGGDVMDLSSTEPLCTPDSFDAIVCDPPYNVGAPVLVDGIDARPQNHHRNADAVECDKRGDSIPATDLVPHLLDVARLVLVSGGRIFFFLPVRGEEQSTLLEELLESRGWRARGQPQESLRLLGDSSRPQRFSPTFSRWLVCMEKL